MEISQPVPQLEEKEKIILGFSYYPFLVDYLLRWTLLGLRHYEIINEWFFWVGQIIFIPCIVYIWATMRSTKIKNKHGGTAKVRYEPAGTVWSSLTAIMFIFSGSYITYHLLNTPFFSEWWGVIIKWIIAALVFVVYGVYIIFIYLESFQDTTVKKTESNIEALKEETSEANDDIGAIDKNDIDIVEMEAEIHSITQRVDTYTLESALFGALGFSGYLTLIASDKLVFPNTKTFSDIFLSIPKYITSQNPDVLISPLAMLFTKDNLIATITLETLICSLLFVLVIVSRIRLYDILRKADYAVRIAVAYNQKEEEAHDTFLSSAKNDKNIEKRLVDLNKRITEAVDSARPLFSELWSIVDYMKMFRNMGIACFIVILITSAYWIWSLLGFLFIALCIIVYSYTTFDEITRNRRLQDIHFFQRQSLSFLTRTPKRK